MKKLIYLFVAVLFLGLSLNSFAQVSVTATAGTLGPTPYTTLKLAFDAVNAGTHQGVVTIQIQANTTEGTTPATLNSSGAGSASYTSVLVFPSVDGVSISGNPVTGFGVIQLNGADNVTIDGDNPNTAGVNRNLTVNNTTLTTVIANSAIRIATSAAVTSADNNTIKNCNLNGNVTSGNASAITSATGSSNSSFGIYCGGNGGATAIGAPTAITSVTAQPAPNGTTINNLIIDNNAINQCARGIVFNGAVASVSNGVTVSNNTLGTAGTPTPATPPYTSPATTVYTKGIWIAGTSLVSVTGNTLQNIMSYVGTTMTTVELVSPNLVSTISNNTISNLTNNGTASIVKAILISNSATSYNISGNSISNTQALAGASGEDAIEVTGATTAGGTIQLNVINGVYNRSTGTFGTYGINLTAGNNVTFVNNCIADLKMDMTGGAAYSTTFGIHGIRIAGGTGHKVYQNSVNLFGALFGSANSSLLTSAFTVVNTTQTGMDVRNNIFSNSITGGTTTISHVAECLPSGGTASMNLTNNYNAYYAASQLGQAGTGTVSGYTIADFDPSTTAGATNWRNYTSTLGVVGSDANSFAQTGVPPFVSPTNLHITGGCTVTKLESGGTTAVGVTTDIDGNVRPGPAGSTCGGAISNDIGCDEFDGAIPAPPADNDVGISAANFGIEVISEGKCYNFKATVKNYGLINQNAVPVYYTIDGGSAVGPVNTVGPIVPGGTEEVSFNAINGFNYCGLSAGPHTFSIYTSLVSSPPAINRAPLVVVLTVLAKITTLPYTQTWNTLDGWSVLTTNSAGANPIWVGPIATTSPDGVANDPSIAANYYAAADGRIEYLRSREFDFTTVANPVLNFYVAYKAYQLEQDKLEVMVSTDHGVTFAPVSPAYSKTWQTNPHLSTLPASTTQYLGPTTATQWRHETVDLSFVGNVANVVIGFKATSAFGNNGFIDNIIVSAPSGYCTSNVGPAPSSTSICKIALNFTNTPTPPPFAGINVENKSINVKSDKSTLTGNSFPLLVGNEIVKTISQNQTDNPTGGNVFVNQYYNINPGQVVNANPGNSNPNGSTGTPDVVYWQNAHWFRVTYDGNDQTGYATYNISIDIGLYGFTNATAGNCWLLKRPDNTGNWNALTTTLVGTTLTASGLTDFCDFAFGDIGGVQPVELSSFVSTINGNNVTLNWTTATENNNSGFDVERSLVNGTWSKVGSVTGNGTTTSPSNYSFTDRNVASGNYSYRLKQIDFNGNFEYFNLNNEVNVGIPSKFELSQNYPNPFNPSTSINFDLPFDAKVSLKIFDMSGKEVATLVNGAITAGYHSVNFNASNLSSGIYFYRINAEGNGNNFVATKKMSLIK